MSTPGKSEASTDDDSQSPPTQTEEAELNSDSTSEPNSGTETVVASGIDVEVPEGASDDDLPDELTIAELEDDARPHRFSSIHRVNGEDSEASQIALCDLHENDYDPRRELDRTEVAERADAIEQTHGHVVLTVRPIEGTVDASGQTQFEVIKGRRDLAALRKIHGKDSDWLVDCSIRDVDDRTAMLMMLEAHEWQVGFSEVEKARVYAKLLTVTYGSTEQSLEEYLDDARSATGEIRLPSNVHSGVKALDDDLRPGPDTIARRLRLLLLPEQAQRLVSTGDLRLRIAEIIVNGLRDLTDPAARREQMLELATSGYDHNTKDELRDRIKTIQQSQASPDQPEVTEERIEELEQTSKQQETALKTKIGATIDFFNGHDLTTETLDQSGLAQPLEKAESVIDACEAEAERLEPERIDPLIEQKGRLQTTRTRTETNRTEREEEPHQSSDAECSYCGCEVRSSDLKTRSKNLDQQIEELDSQISTLRNDRRKFQKKAHKLEDLCDQLVSAQSDLERARTKRSDSESEPDGAEDDAARDTPENAAENDDSPVS